MCWRHRLGEGLARLVGVLFLLGMVYMLLAHVP